MTDLEFLERLRRELTTSSAWSDIGRVVTAAKDPALAENELRVYPVRGDPAAITVSVFRLIVEWEIGDADDAAPAPATVDQNEPPQPDKDPDGTIN